ncbi:Uncharacterised protein [Candidatus Burarchaeum australiense]|nr:Uncharacterised protein [Candidatus Burarchaeum australiense]
MSHMSRLLLSFVCLLVLASISFAQCLESFNAVNAGEFTLSAGTYRAGDTLSGSILITNSFNYSLSASTLVIKVVRDTNVSFGGDVVGEFIAAQNFSLAPMASDRVTITRRLPAGMAPGKYWLTAYVHSGTFDTGGASFMDGMYIGTTSFVVTNDYPDYVLINRSTILLSGQQYAPTDVSSQVEQAQGANVSVSFNLTNVGEAGTVSVTYRLYLWDKYKTLELERLLATGVIPADSALAQRLKNASVVAGITSIDVSANSSTGVSIPIGVLPSDAYLLEIEARKKESRSLLDVRIPVKGPMGAIRFAAVSPYALEQSKPARVLACLSSITEMQDLSEDTTPQMQADLQIALYSGNSTTGTPLYSDSRILPLSPEVSPATFDFLPTANASELTLLLYLYTPDGTTLMDASEVHYAITSSERPPIFKLQSAEAGGMIKYTLSLTDSAGGPLVGNVVIFVMDTGRKTVNSLSTAITGKFEGTFAAPPGGYILEARETTRGLMVNDTNSTPYSADRARNGGQNGGGSGTPGPQPPKPGTEPLSIITLIAAVFLAAVLAAFAIYVLKMFKKKME